MFYVEYPAAKEVFEDHASINLQFNFSQKQYLRSGHILEII